MFYPSVAEFKKIILNLDFDNILYSHIIEGIPYIFKEDSEKYQVFREHISSRLDVPIKNIVIVGSARLGFSLNPNHFGTPFRPNSDIDTVVVSAELFDKAWLELFRLSSKSYELSKDEKEKVENHKKLIFWGNIRPDKLPYTTEISRLWLEVFRSINKIENLSAREINGFLFRSWWQVQSYYLIALRKLRAEIN